MSYHRFLPAVLLVLLPAASLSVQAADEAANVWRKAPKAEITGRRWDVPVGYAPELQRFLVLGGRMSFADAKKPRSYDVLALDDKEGQWENHFPKDKDWGPKFGAGEMPNWKDEGWHFNDVKGVTRPNWTIYGTLSLAQTYDYDHDTKRFYFHAKGKTFSYDPSTREWKDLAPATNPEKELGGILLWSSMCYDRDNKRFVLFGGGNIQSERGDPGTWTYTPATNKWEQLKLDTQPPQRAHSKLVYDPVHKKIVLFGGDQLDQLLSDTWAFDVATSKWEQKKPARSPQPRAGHSLLWLPKAKKVLLLGGYTYTSAEGYVTSLYAPLPLEAWTYDVAADRWDLVRRFEPAKDNPQSLANAPLPAAVDAQDRVMILSNGTWLCSLDVSKVDEDGGAKYGAKPGATTRRTGTHDPDWYKKDVAEADPDKLKADLKDMPANRWVKRATPKTPKQNMDWGSSVFAPELDLIVRFSGGHSAYSGTAPVVYDVKTDRYSLPFAPEYPIEYVYSNDQVHGEWSFKQNPWMTRHTYKSTGYDANLKALVFAPHDYTYFYDPPTKKWSRSPERNPYRANFYVVTICTTPEGAIAWADGSKGAGLWQLDAKSRTWKTLPLTGTLPDKSADHHGMAYDSKRDRLLLFSDVGTQKGDVIAYDRKTGKAEALNPAGKDKALVPCRETAYLPQQDWVLIGAMVRGTDDALWWLAYDCAKNAWIGLELAGDDPIGKGTGGSKSGRFNNSMGLMYDPTRHLVWAVGQYSHVHVLKLDAKTVKVHELK